MAEVDTSSYVKPAALPQQKSLLDQVGQFQQLESNRNVIEKQKLDLVNQRFKELSKGFVGLIADKDLNEDKIRKYVTDQVKLGYIPPEMAAQTISQLPLNADANTLRKHLEMNLQHAQTTMEALNYNFGQNATVSDGATNTQGVMASPAKGGGFTPATQQNLQLPPGTPNVDTEGQKGYLGPAGPAGTRPARMAVEAPPPVAAPAPSPAPLQAGPVNNPAIPGQSSNFGGRVLSANVEPPTAPATFAERIDAARPQGRVITDLGPGVSDARGTVAVQSGKDFAQALSRAGNIQNELQPDLAVLNIVKDKKPGDFGPGTDALNQLKKIAVTWLPKVDPKTINDSSDYDTVKKYLVQGARSAGNTATNDQLAAAFEANPNTTMNTATIENIVKSRVALKKMEAAQALLADKEDVKAENFSKWKAKNQNNFDARAFGFDIMSDEAKKKLVTELKKDPKALKKFEYSLQFAHDADLIAPPARKAPEALPGKRSDAGNNNVVMSDADPEPVKAGQRYAQTVMRPLGNGQVQVINPRTGQVLYTGSAAGAANAQANNGGMLRRVID